MCILMGKRLADFKTVVPYYKVFGLRTQKTTSFFKEKQGLVLSFYEIEVYVVTKCSTWLEKYQTIEILLRVDF